MIATAKHKSGSSGSCLGYILGDKLKKDQRIRIVDFNGFALSRLKIAELEKVPVTDDEKKAHKKNVWKIANDLSKIFDARAALADYRVNDPFEDYVISCVNGERERLRRIPTAEERAAYGMPELKNGETDDRTLERIIVKELLEKIGVHGQVEKKLRRKTDGKKHMVTEIVEREAMYIAVAHDGASHPHMHVLSARPDANGKVNDTRNEKRRIVAAVQELSKKYNLALKLKDYEVDLEKTNEGYATKIQMKNFVIDTLKTAKNRNELKEALAGADIIPTWKVHSETGKEYGILFTKIDKNGKEHTWSGSQLDRSLSYGNIMKRLAANQQAASATTAKTVTEAPVHKETGGTTAAQKKGLVVEYRFILPVIEQLLTTASRIIKFEEETIRTGVKLNRETEKKKVELVETVFKLSQLNAEAKKAESDEKAAVLVSMAVAMLNPVAALMVALLVLIIADIRQERINEERHLLLEKSKRLRGEIKELEKQKAQIKENQRSFIDEIITDRSYINAYRENINALDEEINRAEVINTLRTKYPFTSPSHIQYIVHDTENASIFRADETGERYSHVPITVAVPRGSAQSRRGNMVVEDKYEVARLMLKERGYFVTSDLGPNEFYEHLYEQLYNSRDYRVGEMNIQPNGAVVFGKEHVFGEAANTAPAFATKPVKPQQAPVPTKLEESPKKAVPETVQEEVVANYRFMYTDFRIIKAPEGYRLQQHEYDEKSVVNGKYTKMIWRNKAAFTAYNEVGRDANGICLFINDATTGKPRYVNQYGVTLNNKRLQQLGIRITTGPVNWTGGLKKGK